MNLLICLLLCGKMPERPIPDSPLVPQLIHPLTLRYSMDHKIIRRPPPHPVEISEHAHIFLDGTELPLTDFMRVNCTITEIKMEDGMVVEIKAKSK